jgi:hypothetical protein
MNLHSEQQTGAHRLIIKQDCTRTANTVLAAHMSTRQTEIIPKKIR